MTPWQIVTKNQEPTAQFTNKLEECGVDPDDRAKNQIPTAQFIENLIENGYCPLAPLYLRSVSEAITASFLTGGWTLPLDGSKDNQFLGGGGKKAWVERLLDFGVEGKTAEEVLSLKPCLGRPSAESKV